MYNIQIPDDIKTAIDLIEEAGEKAYIVGGCVRNQIIGMPVKDFDITTSAVPEKIKEIFKDYEIGEIGIAHGTVVVTIDKVPIEITTHRIDTGCYSDGRHPDSIEFTDSIEKNLQRRDFTVNAIAYSPSSGLIDPYGGLDDINNKIIRTVRDPLLTFAEDYLRIMRGIRFASTLGFTIETETEETMRDLWDTIFSVSEERIAFELKKTLQGQNVDKIISRYGWKLKTIAYTIPLKETQKSVNKYKKELGEKGFTVLKHLRVRAGLDDIEVEDE